jgi:hypothetical protein
MFDIDVLPRGLEEFQVEATEYSGKCKVNFCFAKSEFNVNHSYIIRTNQFL